MVRAFTREEELGLAIRILNDLHLFRECRQYRINFISAFNTFCNIHSSYKDRTRESYALLMAAKIASNLPDYSDCEKLIATAQYYRLEFDKKWKRKYGADFPQGGPRLD